MLVFKDWVFENPGFFTLIVFSFLYTLRTGFIEFFRTVRGKCNTCHEYPDEDND